MGTKNAQVETDDVEEVEDDLTLSDEGVSEETETPEQPASDVEAIKADYETRLATMTSDMNAMKSSLQRRESTIQADNARRTAELQKQLKAVRLGNMDEEQRKKYEADLLQEELQNLNTQISELSREKQNQEAVLNALTFWLAQGVPQDKLVTDQGYDALVNSGWAYIRDEREQLKARVNGELPKKSVVKTTKKAPSVVTDKAAPSGTGSTWPALVKKYGSEERVWQLVESGQLDPSILPKVPNQ